MVPKESPPWREGYGYRHRKYGGRNKKHDSHIFIQTQEAEKEQEVGKAIKASDTSDRLPLSRLHLLKIPQPLQLHHQPGTKCSRGCIGGGRCSFKSTIRLSQLATQPNPRDKLQVQ